MAIFSMEDSSLNEYKLLVLQEKKTREQYARDKFKKKYNFKPDKPGSDIGTITVDGKTYNVDMKKSKNMKVYNSTTGEYDTEVPRQTSADLGAKEKKINLDNNFFKLKGSNKGERRDAILRHEIGHANMHGIAADKEMRSPTIYKKTVTKAAKDAIGIDISKDDPIGLGKGTGHDIRKSNYDMIDMKKYVQNSPSKKERKGREQSYSDAEKYENGGDHAHAHEFEADRYAANKTSERAIKKGVANSYKFFRKENNSLSSQNKKLLNKMADNDMKQRSKALKDKNLRKSKYYK